MDRTQRAGQLGGGRAPVTPCGPGMWCWSVSSVGVERGGCPCGGYQNPSTSVIAARAAADDSGLPRANHDNATATARAIAGEPQVPLPPRP